MKKDLVFESGTSSKFWSVEVTGSDMTVVFGRTGSKGQTKTKSFASPADATAAAEKLAAQKTKKGYAVAGKAVAAKTKAPAKKVAAKKKKAPANATKKAATKKAAGSKVTAPSELRGSARRFKGQRIAFSGRFEHLRKDDLMEVLAKEGAKFDDKLGDKTTLLLFAVAGSANHKRAQKLKDAGQDLTIVSEGAFRATFLVPTPSQTVEMLASRKDAKRLGALLEQAREEYSRGTDEFSEVHVKKAKLGGVDLSGVELYGVLLEDSDLRKATLKKSYASGWVSCDLRGADAPEAQFYELQRCDFREAKLTKASLDGVSACLFQSADLTRTSWSEVLTDCRFDGATLDHADMNYVKLKSCSFAKASLQSVQLSNTVFTDCSFQSADLREASFSGHRSVTFEDCDFRKADFRGAWLLGVRFVRCKLDGARFDGAHYDQVEFDKTDTAKAKNFDWVPTPMGPALMALSVAAPTFRNVTIEVTLKSGSKSPKCILYQFDHNANSSQRQAYLAGDDLGALALCDAMRRIATLHPDATLKEKTLKVKQSKGKKAPSHKPAAFKELVLEAWREALA